MNRHFVALVVVTQLVVACGDSSTVPTAARGPGPGLSPPFLRQHPVSSELIASVTLRSISYTESTVSQGNNMRPTSQSRKMWEPVCRRRNLGHDLKRPRSVASDGH